jgi:hypothetical protein
VNEICDLLGFHAAFSLENGTSKLSRNVGKTMNLSYVKFQNEINPEYFLAGLFLFLILTLPGILLTKR